MLKRNCRARRRGGGGEEPGTGGGVDTHGDVHVTAAIDTVGRTLATASFPTTPGGYRQLLGWLGSFGTVGQVGVEGTGTYGAGLARYLQGEGVAVVEINRPDRQRRRRRGKSDTTDAEAAARAVLSGDASGVPKSGDGIAEGLRALRVARRSAMKARTQASNQIRDLVLTARDELRGKLRGLTTDARVEICVRLRPGPVSDVAEATKKAFRVLARRHQALTAEIAELDDDIAALCAAKPALL